MYRSCFDNRNYTSTKKQKNVHKKTVDPLDLLSFILKKKPSFRILLHPNRKTFSIIFSLFLHYFSLARIAFTSSTSLSVAAAICSTVKPFLYIFRIRLASPSGDGEIAQKQIFQLDEERIREESMYDGFYAVVTNLEGDVRDIININRRRWEIEENFRIMKTEFEAQPVFVRREDSIKAHFLTCYISLLVYRLLEKKLGEEFTCSEILKTLREMNMTLLSKDSGYIPSYKRTKLTDALHTAFGFRTDYEFISKADMRTIIKETKQKK